MEIRICSRCKRELPATLEYFHASKREKLGLRYNCKNCHNKESQLWAEENKDKIRARDRARVRIRTKENREQMKEYKKEYRRNNQEKIKLYNKKYRKINRNKRIIEKHIRRATLRDLPIGFTVEQWEECKQYFGQLCAYCGGRRDLTQDHFIPLLEGGEYTINNIVPACETCNSSKCSRDFFLWYPQQPFYSKKRELKILKYLGYKGNTQQLSIL